MTRSDRWLERVALGEVDADDLTEEEQKRLDEIRASNEEILAKYPAAGVKIEVERRMKSAASPTRRTPWIVGLLPVAAAAVVLAIALPDEPTERTKGDARLVVHKKTGASVTPVRDDDVLDAGDLLQVGYTPGGAGYGTVLSIDGRGTVTLHWPRSASDWSPQVEPGGASLPVSYELDDAPRFERFFLVTCPERFVASRVVAAAEAIAPSAEETALTVEAGCRTDAMLVRKANP